MSSFPVRGARSPAGGDGRIAVLAGLLVAVAAAPTCSAAPPELPSDMATEARPEAAPELGRPDVRGRPDALRLRPDGAVRVGSSCATDHDCSAGYACDQSLPGGICTRTCADDSECGSSSVWACNEGRCYARCDPRSLMNPCRPAYVCRLVDTKAVCVPSCEAVGCPAGWSCDSRSGICLDPTSGGLGAECGPELGGCDGVPNGTCYSLGGLTAAFCTLPCSPFTRPCPVTIPGASCVLGHTTKPYCGFLCEPDGPSCPHPAMGCVDVGGGFHVCLPQ